ncbi:PIN domain-containing protein [Microbacterium gorillae]|uniref:PIN domain-containing protein n=1 Tax=Microbacterium gorillae TaxID=1231063 RepID=UPI003D984749
MTAIQVALLDTDVYSALFITPAGVVARQGHPVAAWRLALAGSRPVISFQTRAEVLAGALLAGWGQKRLDQTRAQLDATPTVDEDVDVVDAYSRLLADARSLGHPLGTAKDHVGDRWIAACAIAKQLPLLTGNTKHFRGAPGLELIAY